MSNALTVTKVYKTIDIVWSVHVYIKHPIHNINNQHLFIKILL